ncbi:unnamed protein product [Darwinula stevensoni]|uniref:Uncharacterized protein n=1 Tax=Darwinula stevensoni TaxID=69355 RepID=A0A7R9FQU2_9CRUS|nr:unnamed protein product [Darwinula stevensoni]CAG0900372.1 unnamed protein product [Darwinula stevensoni]
MDILIVMEVNVIGREMNYETSLEQLKSVLKADDTDVDADAFIVKLAEKNLISEPEETELKSKNHHSKIDDAFDILCKKNPKTTYESVLGMLQEMQRNDIIEIFHKSLALKNLQNEEDNGPEEELNSNGGNETGNGLPDLESVPTNDAGSETTMTIPTPCFTSNELTVYVLALQRFGWWWARADKWDIYLMAHNPMKLLSHQLSSPNADSGILTYVLLGM